MGSHNMGKDGISYLSRELGKGETGFRKVLVVIRHKCYRLIMHNGTHVTSLIVLHVAALYILQFIPFVPH